LAVPPYVFQGPPCSPFCGMGILMWSGCSLKTDWLCACVQKGDHRTALKKYRKSLRYLDVCWEKGELDEGNKFLELLIALII
jgi:hypothetical protein